MATEQNNLKKERRKQKEKNNNEPQVCILKFFITPGHVCDVLPFSALVYFLLLSLVAIPHSWHLQYAGVLTKTQAALLPMAFMVFRGTLGIPVLLHGGKCLSLNPSVLEFPLYPRL